MPLQDIIGNPGLSVVFEKVIGYLDTDSLLAASKTCQTWRNEIMSHQSVWKRQFALTYSTWMDCFLRQIFAHNEDLKNFEDLGKDAEDEMDPDDEYFLTKDIYYKVMDWPKEYLEPVGLSGTSEELCLFLALMSEMMKSDRLFGPDDCSYPMPLFHVASHFGHLDLVQFLMDRGDHKIEVDGEVCQTMLEQTQTPTDGGTWWEHSSPLHLACAAGQVEIVQVLIEKGGAGIEEEGMEDHRCYCTPLHTACDNGHVEVARYLIKKGANLEAQEGHCILDDGQEIVSSQASDMTPLHCAVMNGNLDLVNLLIENGADIEAVYKPRFREYNNIFTPLLLAVDEVDTDVAMLLINKGADIEALNKTVYTPLTLAARNGMFSVTKMLIEKGANIEALDKQKLTPLHWACHRGHLEIACLLINEGAQLEVRQEDGSTPLNLACTSMHPEVAQLLISNGAQVEALCDENLTPLQEVCLSIFDDRPTVSEQNLAFTSALKMVQLLIDNGAQLDAPVVALDSNTLLHIVINAHTNVLKHKTLGMAQLLIKNGSPLEARDEESRTPLHLACIHGSLLLVRLLIKNGADIQAKANHKATPLHYAAIHGHVEVARFLIRKGAQVDARASSYVCENYTPYSLALLSGHTEIMELLIKEGGDQLPMDDEPPLSPASCHRQQDGMCQLL